KQRRELADRSGIHGARGGAVRADSYAARDAYRSSVARHLVLVDDDAALLQGTLRDDAGHAETLGHIDKNDVIVGPAGDDSRALLNQRGGEFAGEPDDARSKAAKLGGARVIEGPRLRRDLVDDWRSLVEREYGSLHEVGQ